MRSRRWCLSGVAAVALVAFGLSGCFGEPADPIESDKPRPTPREPAFASPEEAFDAAVKVYERYYEISNEILAEGGADPDRILEVVAETDNGFVEREFETFRRIQQEGLRVEGNATFSKPRLMQYKDVVDLIQIYACGDVSGTRVIDRDGVEISRDREVLIPYMVTFTITPTREVLVSDSVPWNGEGVC